MDQFKSTEGDLNMIRQDILDSLNYIDANHKDLFPTQRTVEGYEPDRSETDLNTLDYPLPQLESLKRATRDSSKERPNKKDLNIEDPYLSEGSINTGKFATPAPQVANGGDDEQEKQEVEELVKELKANGRQVHSNIFFPRNVFKSVPSQAKLQ